MVKTRMGLLDLRVQTAKLNPMLKGARVTNIYDSQNGRTYVLKLNVPPSRAQSDPSASSSSTSSSTVSAASWEKYQLLIESGVRLHMTHFDRERDIPSGFCLKLRKHIRTRRLEAVRQLGDGGDRIIDLVFSGEGAVCAHLIVEAFAGGNVILTDADYTILTLLRAYRLNDSPDAPTRVAVRERYPIENARAYCKLSRDTFFAAADRALEAVNSVAEKKPTNPKISNRAANRKQYARGVARKSLAMELAIEPSLVEHSIISAGFDAEVRLETLFENEKQGLNTVYSALLDLEVSLDEEMAKGQMKGYIIFKTVDGPKGKVERYDEFSPFLFAQFRDRPIKEFNTFDEAADEFFAKVESDRVEASQAKREAATFKKVDKLETELHGKVAAFEVARDKSSEKAQAIESNIVEVDAALTVINSAIAAAVPWDGLARMVNDEKKNGNPVAEIIHSLQLDRNEITLMLEDTFGDDDEEEENDDEDDNDNRDADDDDMDDEDDDDGSTEDPNEGNKGKRKDKNIFKPSAESRAALLVSVDLGLSAHSNARRYYEMRKSAAAKMETAVMVKNRTVKAASKRAATEAQRLEEEAVAASIRARRKPFWFEKFYWFVSSENYLVVAGRDDQQNDLLVKRYLGPADAYVNADLDGTASVIVKNRRHNRSAKHNEIPRMTLEQAGVFAMSRSAAWDSKIVTSAWWVRATQVTKTTSTGEYLPTGSFAIRGRKNFLDPAQLVMGFGFLFRVDEVSAEHHKNERGLREEIPEAPPKDEIVSKTEDISLHDSEAVVDVSSTIGVDKNDENDENTEHANDIVKPPTTENREDKALSVNKVSVDEISQDSISEQPGQNPEKLTEANGVEKPKTDTREAAKASNPRSKKRHLSAKERRALKSGRGGGKELSPQNSGDKDEASSQSKQKAKEEKSGKEAKAGAPLPRGKKHKLKKMKKYLDQDEDERRLALAVLGAKPIKEEIDDTVSEQKNDEDEGANEAAEETKAAARSKQFVREPKQEDLRLLDEEGLAELDRLEQDTMQALSLLTAVPTTADAVEFALPVCGPYSALSQFRYRVKMMPGNMKRGKAYRSASVLFQRQAEKDLSTFKQERDAMRLSPESEGIHGMIGNVKIMAPGLADAQKALTKAKKGSAGSKKGKQK